MKLAQSSAAIVLRWRAYGESDKIVTLLTRDFGKLTGIAKGARRSRRRFVNSLELLARVQAYFRHTAGASLIFLERCDLLHSHDALRDPARFAYASYLAELADQMTAEEQPVPDLYALLDEGLTILCRRPASAAFLRAFELQLLARAGYEPQLERCHRCRQLVSDTSPFFLDLHQGAFLCPDCTTATRAAAREEVAGFTLRRLAALQKLPLTACGPGLLEGRGTEAARVTGRLLAPHLHRPLKSLAFIGQTTSMSKQGDPSPAETNSPVNGAGRGP